MSGTKLSSIEESARPMLRVGLVLFLTLPYLIWLERLAGWDVPALSEIWPLAALSIKQSLFSSVLAMVAGFVLFLGFQGFSKRGTAELVLLLPNMIPPLFIGLSLLSWVTPFPYGLLAVVLAHALVNSGLVAVALDRVVQARLRGMAEVAWLLGSSRWRFWREIGWPQLKGDVACIFLFVFSVCLTSFSFPLLLAGGKLVTLEMAIFNAIRVEGRWDKAVIMAALQSVILLTLAWSLPHSFWPTRRRITGLHFLAVKSMRILLFLPALLVALGWLKSLRKLPEVSAEIVAACLSSLALGLAAGVLTLALLIAVAYVSPHDRFKRFLNGYLAPSPTITGFALLLVPGGDFIKLVVALTLISLPILYRWIVHSSLQSLEPQIVMARTLGASWRMIFTDVVWPQTGESLLRAAGVASVWASADFALTGIVMGNLSTLPLVIEDFIGRYQIEVAETLLLPLVVIGLTLYGFFVSAWGWAFFTARHRKSIL